MRRNYGIIFFAIVSLFLTAALISCEKEEVTQSDLTTEYTAALTEPTAEPTECEHSMVLTASVEPTCTEVGLGTDTCEKCGYAEKREMPRSAHEYSVTERLEPTCALKGREVSRCVTCGLERVSELARSEHDSSEPTCTQPARCAVCGRVTASALGHTVTYYRPSDEQKICERCDTLIVDSHEHKFSRSGHNHCIYCGADGTPVSVGDGFELVGTLPGGEYHIRIDINGDVIRKETENSNGERIVKRYLPITVTNLGDRVVTGREVLIRTAFGGYAQGGYFLYNSWSHEFYSLHYRRGLKKGESISVEVDLYYDKEQTGELTVRFLGVDPNQDFYAKVVDKMYVLKLNIEN